MVSDGIVSILPFISTLTLTNLQTPICRLWALLCTTSRTCEIDHRHVVRGPIPENSVVPSRERAMPQGRVPPVAISDKTWSVAVSTIATLPPRPVLTRRRFNQPSATSFSESKSQLHLNGCLPAGGQRRPRKQPAEIDDIEAVGRIAHIELQRQGTSIPLPHSYPGRKV